MRVACRPSGPSNSRDATPSGVGIALLPMWLVGDVREKRLVLPLLIRALFGEKLKTLQEEIQPHVAQSVAFFLAACRTGGVT